MTYKVTKTDGDLKGTIVLPSSKSISNRLLIIKALCKDHFEIKNLSQARDTQILRQLLDNTDVKLDVGDAGTTMRFLTAYLANQRHTIPIEKSVFILTGSARMKQRPISILVDALRDLGANIEYLEKKGYPPLRIQSTVLKGNQVNLDGSVSSQYVSALLMIAPLLPNGIKIKMTQKVSSRPYIKMTLKIMKSFGIKSTWKNDTIHVEHSAYSPRDYSVEADWSSASYWYSMAALAKNVDLTIKGLEKESIQGDSIAAQIFELLGVKTRYISEGLHLSKGGYIVKELAYDFSDCPDLAQAVVVTASALGIPGLFSGLESLRIKETERIAALKKELDKLGLAVEEISDGCIKVNPKSKIVSPKSEIDTYNDHRMAMAFAALALKIGKIRIQNPDVVAKSYPGFWNDLKKVKFNVEVV